MPGDETVNLLQETLEIMGANDRTPDDVRWVGDANGWCDWDAFAALADFRYDNGFGGEVIATSLLVVGDDWWLERHEYDGSEWWEYKTLPARPKRQRTPASLLDGDSWDTRGSMTWADE